MRLPKRGEKGFTLIELLIVVAILGVLAAVIIPNVGRFMGRGEEEARRVEFNTVRTAIVAMMVENGIAELPNPHVYISTGLAVNDMSAFPDSISSWVEADDSKLGKTTDPDGTAYTTADGDKAGYLLYGHDIIGGDGADAATLVNTVSTKLMEYYYTCNAAGEIQQFNMADLDGTGIEEYTY